MKDKEEKTQEDFERDAERADDLRQEWEEDKERANNKLWYGRGANEARESLIFEIWNWADKEHVGEITLDDLATFLESKRKGDN